MALGDPRGKGRQLLLHSADQRHHVRHLCAENVYGSISRRTRGQRARPMNQCDRSTSGETLQPCAHDFKEKNMTIVKSSQNDDA